MLRTVTQNSIKHNEISYLWSISSLSACNKTEQCQKQTDQLYATVSDSSESIMEGKEH